MFETWAPIPGYEGRWEVSTEGRVRSIPRRRTRGGILSPRTNKRGYPSVGLGYQRLEVHKLVALTFLGQRPPGAEIRHLDGDPLNSRVSNLAYGTRSENRRDRLSHGTDHNRNKTHCPQGHPYYGENLLIVPSRPTARYCRACNAARKATVKTGSDYDESWRP